MWGEVSRAWSRGRSARQVNDERDRVTNNDYQRQRRRDFRCGQLGMVSTRSRSRSRGRSRSRYQPLVLAAGAASAATIRVTS